MLLLRVRPWARLTLHPSQLVVSAASAAVVCIALPASAWGAAVTPSVASDGSSDVAAIDRYVQSEMIAQHIPGLAVGIVRGSRIGM